MEKRGWRFRPVDWSKAGGRGKGRQEGLKRPQEPVKRAQNPPKTSQEPPKTPTKFCPMLHNPFTEVRIESNITAKLFEPILVKSALDCLY